MLQVGIHGNNGISRGMGHASKECILVTKVSREGVLDFHDSQKAEITITVTDIRSPFGVVKLHKNKVVLFEEKPMFSYYIGHMIMNKRVLDQLNPKLLKEPDGSGLISLFQHTIGKGTLGAFVHKGLQLTFNTLQEHKKADEEMMKFFTEQES